jgi:hypothetical protein
MRAGEPSDPVPPGEQTPGEDAGWARTEVLSARLTRDSTSIDIKALSPVQRHVSAQIVPSVRTNPGKLMAGREPSRRQLRPRTSPILMPRPAQGGCVCNPARIFGCQPQDQSTDVPPCIGSAVLAVGVGLAIWLRKPSLVSPRVPGRASSCGAERGCLWAGIRRPSRPAHPRWPGLRFQRPPLRGTGGGHHRRGGHDEPRAVARATTPLTAGVVGAHRYCLRRRSGIQPVRIVHITWPAQHHHPAEVVRIRRLTTSRTSRVIEGPDSAS